MNVQESCDINASIEEILQIVNEMIYKAGHLIKRIDDMQRVI